MKVVEYIRLLICNDEPKTLSTPKPKVSPKEALAETESSGLKNYMHAKFTLKFKLIMCTTLGNYFLIRKTQFQRFVPK